MDSGDDDSRGDAGMDDDDALQAEVTATQTREKLNDALIKFWRGQLRDVSTMNPTLTELKNHPLPLARIKKIMKSDEDVRMISSEAPVLFAKACELFILELTHRAWAFSEANKRRTLQHNDVTAAILNHEHEVFEFLTDIFANEDGTIPEADAAAASLLAAHNPATLPQPSTSASGGSQAGGAVAQGYSAQGPQQGQAMGAHPPRTDAGAGPSNAQYGAPYGGQYAAWPGMQQGMPPPQQQQQQHMMGNMDPKMQEHLNQQMQLAQEQYMQRHAQQQGHMQPGSRQPPS